jgi:hypothetical protein
MVFISATRLRLRSSRFLPQLIWYSLLSIYQAKRAPGNLGVKTRRQANNVYWTLTAWENEEAMKVFRGSSWHKKAMPKLAHWCDEASVVHWSQDTAALPDWDEASKQMATNGRLSKVNHPSPAHLAKQTV